MKHWTSVLTKSDKQHLKDAGGCDIRSIKSFTKAREFQIKNNIKCFECESIARKLGIN